MVYPRYSLLFPSLKAVRDSLENSYFARQAQVEKEAMEKYEKEGAYAAAKYLNEYSVKVCDQMISRWRQLATYLIVKYNDMIIHPEEDGKFTRDEFGLGSRPKRPGYPDRYKRELIKQTGDKFACPE